MGIGLGLDFAAVFRNLSTALCILCEKVSQHSAVSNNFNYSASVSDKYLQNMLAFIKWKQLTTSTRQKYKLRTVLQKNINV